MLYANFEMYHVWNVIPLLVQIQTAIVNELRTDDDRWTIETSRVKLKVVVHVLETPVFKNYSLQFNNSRLLLHA